MAKPAHLNEKVLRNKVRKAKKEIRGATREIRRLMKGSKGGTLDRRELESGLRRMSVHLREIPDHWNNN
jgi:plasmid stabilization system protein ParE